MSLEASNWVWSLEDISPTRKLVMLCIANFADEHHQSFPSNSYIAKKVNLKDPKGVQRIIKELESLGYIKRDPRFKEEKGGKRAQTSNLYTLLIPQGLHSTSPHRSVAPLPTATQPPNTKEDTKENTKRNNKEKKLAQELLFSIKEIYESHFPEHKQKKISDTHTDLIASLLKKPPKFEEEEGKLTKQPVDTLEWWDEYFAFCGQSKQLKTGWEFQDGKKIADLEFLLRRRTMGKVFNLDYHPELKRSDI